MFGSSLVDLALRRVWNHQTHRSRMSSTSLSKFAVLVFYIRRAVVSLPFQVHRLQVLIEASLIAFPNACFKLFADEGLEKAQHGSLANLPKIFAIHLSFTAFRWLVLWGFSHRRLLASSLGCHAAFISASTPGPAHQLRAPRGRLECGASSAAMESMTSAMGVTTSLMQVPSGIGGSVATIAFAVWNRRFGSAINRLRPAVVGVSLVLYLLRFVADLRRMRNFAYTRM